MTVVGASYWDVACDLLTRWQQSGAAPPQRDDAAFDEWLAMRKRMEEVLTRHPRRERLSSAEADVASDLSDAGPVGAHAAAWAIDERCWPTFSRPWVADRVVVPGSGDLFPLAEWDTEFRPLERRLSRPWQTQMLDDELPHVRRFRPRPGDPAIEFDGRYFDELSFLEAIRIVAGAVLNDGMDEFEQPASGFGIQAADLDRQARLVDAATATALELGAELLVFPELAVPAPAIAALVDRVVASSRNVAVVAGSSHQIADGRRSNVSTLITPVGDAIEFTKRTPFWDATAREAIEVDSRRVRILVAGNVRLAVAICKDSIAAPLVDVLTHGGANLIVVPSMSRLTSLHEIEAATFSMRSHALTAIVNGPRSFGEEEPPQLIICRPEVDDALRKVYVRGVPAASVVRADLVTGGIDVEPCLTMN